MECEEKGTHSVIGLKLLILTCSPKWIPDILMSFLYDCSHRILRFKLNFSIIKNTS